MDFIDITPNDFGMRRTKIIDYPKYIDKALKQINSDSKSDDINLSPFNCNNLFHTRPPSIYEDLMFLGTTGFFLLINIIQMIGFMFLIWSILFFFKEYNVMVAKEGKWVMCFFISLFIVYVCAFAYLLTLNLKWYTIISSVNFF